MQFLEKFMRSTPGHYILKISPTMDRVLVSDLQLNLFAMSALIESEIET